MFPLLKRKRRVLLLDDDPAIQRLVPTLLEREGYRVDVVGKGREAIDAIERGDYSAILLDLMMPFDAKSLTDTVNNLTR